MDLTIAVPLLGRPHRVVPVAESIAANTPPGHRVVFACTPGDQLVIDAVLNCGVPRDLVVMDADYRNRGDYARKINRVFDLYQPEVIFCGADDLKFWPNWWTHVERWFEEPRIGVVGTNDLCNPRVKRGAHSTHSAIRGSYVRDFGTVDRFGLVLHPGYPHECVDDELVETAKARFAYGHAPNAIVEHLHPGCDKAPMDDLYADQPARMLAGRAMLTQRRHLWESLTPAR